MATIQFVLNEKRIREAGHCVENAENYLRTLYARHHAEEIAYLTFQRDGEHAGRDLRRIGWGMRKDPLFVSFLEKCVLDTDGEVEDCLPGMKESIVKHDR